MTKTSKQDSEKAILDIAEEMVREGGYNSFSFRNIATAVGIKSSSVHYHFATKEELGVALIQHYTDKFLLALGDPKELHAQQKNPVQEYISAFRTELEQDKGMCLCGMLGAEADGLPERVVAEIRVFFQRNVDWLERAYSVNGDAQAKAHALKTLALLEGAMIISNTHHDLALFDLATESLRP